MNKEDKAWWKKFRAVNKYSLEHEEYMQVCEIYARVKNIPPHYPCKGCGTSGAILQGYIDEVNLIFESL